MSNSLAPALALRSPSQLLPERLPSDMVLNHLTEAMDDCEAAFDYVAGIHPIQQDFKAALALMHSACERLRVACIVIEALPSEDDAVCLHEWHKFGTVNGLDHIACQKCGAVKGGA